MKQVASQPVAPINFEDTSVAFAHLSTKKLRKTYAIFWLMNQNLVVNIGTILLNAAFKVRLPINSLVKKTLFSQFCGGESIKDCQKTIDTLAASGVGTILDYSVEGEDSEADFDATAEEIIRTIHLSAAQPDKIPFSVFKVTGIGAFDILAKKADAKAVLSANEQAAFDRMKQRLERIAGTAFDKKVRLFFDAEESWIQDTIDDLCYEMMQKYNRGAKVIIYNTYQFYLKESYGNMVAAAEKGRSEGYKIGAKLVRGAYMEKERDRAEEVGYPDPVQPTKAASDADFDRGMAFALDNLDIFAICLGTHNEASCRLCFNQMAEQGIDASDERVFFAQLLGMSDNISYNLAGAGYNVAKYVPYGPVEAVMPYLMRRADENTAVAGQSSREYLLVKKEVERRKNLQTAG